MPLHTSGINGTPLRHDEVKLRKAIAVALRADRRHSRRIRSFGPSYVHLRRMERRELRALRVLAALEADMACRNDTTRDYASYKLYLQREAYIRQKLRHEAAVGETFSKLYDVRYNLRSVGGESFEDVTALFPLRPVEMEHYWEPKWSTYIPRIVTDGSPVVGGVRRWEVGGSPFAPVSASLFERDYPWEHRLLYGPIQYFLSMRTMSGENASESADSSVPDKAIKGKKHPRRVDSRSAVKARNKKAAGNANSTAASGKKGNSSSSNVAGTQPASNPTSGFVDCYDYAASAEHGGPVASSSNASPQNKKSNKKASFTPYVEYEDPTLPTAEDLAAQKKADWKEKYIRGDTLYQWVDSSLTEALSSHLYFDDSAPSLRSTSEFIIPSDSSSSSTVYFDDSSAPLPRTSCLASASVEYQIPTASGPSVYFDINSFAPVSLSSHSSDSSWMSGASTDIFFSENDISRFSDDENDLESLISCEDSIYFDHVSIGSSYSTAYEQSWTELDALTANYSIHSSSSLYFDAASATSALSPLAQQLAEPLVTSTPVESSQTFAEVDMTSPKHFDNPEAPMLHYGNSSLRMDFIE